MLICRPRGSTSWNYSVFRNDILVAEVDFNDPEETGAIRIDDKAYSIANDKSWRAGERKLYAGASLLASSLKPSMAVRRFVIEAPELTFELKRTGLFAKKYLISRDQHPLGEIARLDWSSYNTRIEIADIVPPHLQLFSFWLVVMLWHWDSGS
jgi:hypothetical protein